MKKIASLSVLTKTLLPKHVSVPLIYLSTKSQTNNLKVVQKTHEGKLGKALFVGEGNLTYTLEIMRQNKVDPKQLVSTVYESEADAIKIYTGVKSTTAALRKQGVNVVFGVDATSLSSNPILGQKIFDHIQFNYPHHPTTKSNVIQPHQDLITGFFKEAQLLLQEEGIIRVLLNTNYPFGGGKKNVFVVDADNDVDDNVSYSEKGWDILKCAKDAGLICFNHELFEFSQHIVYKPKKGFGKNPNDDWHTGESRFYDFRVHPKNQEKANSLKEEVGSALLDKYSKKKKK